MSQGGPADLLNVQLSPANARREAQVAQAIGQPARLGVAFSGGVDSSLLLALAARHLGADRVRAILAVSASLAASERTAAQLTAAAIGVNLIELPTRELDDPAYRANGPDRCYHCKAALFQQIDDEVAAQHGLEAVAYGENADDVGRPDRPGAAAATEYQVLRPLAQAGLTKAMVRDLARELGLSMADTPANACLASRIPHFDEVTTEKLTQIDRAEQAVRSLGFSDVRVRHHGEVARLELPLDELELAVRPETRQRLVARVRGAGFRYVSLDLAGVQSGAFTLSVSRHD